jgi:HEPN domain-containing protein
MTEAVIEWIRRAEYDLGSARALLASKRNLHALFFCQQAIEKALKGMIQAKTGKFPPRIHNLPRLAELAGVCDDADRMELLSEFSTFYIESRYPDEIDELAAATTNADATRAVKQTEDIVRWLLSILN